MATGMVTTKKALTEATESNTPAPSRRQEQLRFVFVQALIAGANALVGFLILRGLEKPEYAVYTIAFSLLTIFSNITNVGITPAMSAIGGRIWDQPEQLQALVNSALQTRFKLALWFAPPFILYCLWQFSTSGWNAWSLGALVLTLLAIAWVQLQFALYTIVLTLNRAVRGLQRNEWWATVLKFGGIGLLVWLGAGLLWILAWVGVCLAFNLQQNVRLAGTFLKKHPRTTPEFLGEIDRIIRSNFLRTVYWSFEGQISILLCSLFATVENIAEIGALGRLAVYFSIFQAFILNYALPDLSKLQEKTAILRQSRKIMLMSAAVIVPILAWAVLHPDSLLWLLGARYYSLKPLLLYFLLASALGQLAAISYQICAAKAWIQLNRYYVQLALPLQLALVYLLDLSQLSQLILFIGLNSSFFLLYNTVMFFAAYRRYA